LYEDEHGRIQNVLDRAWIELDMASKLALSAQIRTLNISGRLASNLLERLFGLKIVSVRSVGVSLSLSITSLIVGVMAFEFEWTDVGTDSSNVWILVAVGLLLALFIGLALIPILRTNLGSGIVWMVSVITASVLVWGTWAFQQDSFDDLKTLDLSACVQLFFVGCFMCLTSLGCDVGFILITRRALQIISKSQKLPQILRGIMLNYAIVVVLFAMPWYRLVLNPKFHGTIYEGASSWFYLDWETATRALLYANLLGAAVAAVFFAYGLAMLFHRLAWPIIQRPIYAFASLGIARRKVFFSTLGSLLILWALGKPVDWVSSIFGAIK
jgi:hypothetical protein